MRRSILFTTSLGALGLAVGGWWMLSTAPRADAPDDPKLFPNRVWAERTPASERDMVLYFVPIQIGSKKTGMVQRASRFAWGGEWFRWDREGADLVMEMPQNQRTAKVKVRTWKCDDAPDKFDLCLELSAGDRKQRLYSRKGWRVPRGAEALPEALAWLPDPAAAPDPGPCDACDEVGLAVLPSP